jgi:hypothetical protein
MTTCEQCGLIYTSDHKPDVKEHEKRHQKWLKACAKFGYLLPYYEREKLKGVASAIEDKETADTLRFWAWFCRSIQENDYNLNHMSFAEYIEFLKNQKPEIRKTTAPVPPIKK